MKKIILYLRTDIYNQTLYAGGSVSHTIGVIKGFLAHGISVIVATSTMHEQLRKLPLTNLISLKNPSWLHWLRWKLNCLLSNIFFTFQSWKILKLHNPKFIYQRYSILNCTGVLLSALTKTPLILEYNGSEAWVDAHWISKKKWITFSWFIQYIEHINITKANYIVVVSQTLKDELIKRNVAAHKILVNPNGVDTDLFNPHKTENERRLLRTKLGIDNRFVFGFVGTFSVWHGINILAQAIPLVIKQNSNAHFLLIGDGPLKVWLQEQLHNYQDHVTFPGLMAHEYIPGYLAGCDAFLSPTQPNSDGSPFFGSPTKIFEYLSMGKPIIASRIGQLTDIINPTISTEKDLIINDAVGILINPNDVEGFVQAIIRITNTPEKEVECLQKNARTRAIDHYQWNNHVKKIIAFTESNLRL